MVWQFLKGSLVIGQQIVLLLYPIPRSKFHLPLIEGSTIKPFQETLLDHGSIFMVVYNGKCVNLLIHK